MGSVAGRSRGLRLVHQGQLTDILQPRSDMPPCDGPMAICEVLEDMDGVPMFMFILRYRNLVLLSAEDLLKRPTQVNGEPHRPQPAGIIGPGGNSRLLFACGLSKFLEVCQEVVPYSE